MNAFKKAASPNPHQRAMQAHLQAREHRAEVRTVDATLAAQAVRILREVTRWLAERGIDHWSVEELRVADFERAGTAGELALGFVASEAVAVMLLQQTDDVYWPTEAAGSALYIHKLAVRRKYAGQHWSARMVDWAAVQARARAIDRLRLDTLYGSPLKLLYESYGFVAVDRYPIRVAKLPVIRMEKILRCCP